MKVVVTVCSKEKDPDAELLPAVERYLGAHIKRAKEESLRLGIPLYIISGKFGLISGDDFIADYDYLLEKENEPLTRLIKSQIQNEGITEIEFYRKAKDSWTPYVETIRKACVLAEVSLHTHKLEN